MSKVTKIKDLLPIERDFASSYEALKKLVKEVNTYDGRLTMDKMNIKYSKERIVEALAADTSEEVSK